MRNVVSLQWYVLVKNLFIGAVAWYIDKSKGNFGVRRARCGFLIFFLKVRSYDVIVTRQTGEETFDTFVVKNLQSAHQESDYIILNKSLHIE